MTKKQWIADGLLLAAAIIWGSAFAVVKNTLDSVPPSMMIALRFGIAALISGVILRKHLRGLTRGQVLMGLLVGVLTGLAYIVQTIGLQDTTAGKNAFLTTIYVLLVPSSERMPMPSSISTAATYRRAPSFSWNSTALPNGTSRT